MGDERDIIPQRDVEEVGESVRKICVGQVAIGLDLGTKTGYAFTYYDPKVGRFVRMNPTWCGLLDLDVGSFDAGPIRQVRLWHFLEQVHPGFIAFEGRDFGGMSQFQLSGMKAAELSASLRTCVALWSHFHGVPCCAVPIGRIKKRATGSGAADKVAIVKACNAEFKTAFEPILCEKTGADDVCDAVYVLMTALEECGSGIPGLGLDDSGDAVAEAVAKVRVLESSKGKRRG